MAEAGDVQELYCKKCDDTGTHIFHENVTIPTSNQVPVNITKWWQCLKCGEKISAFRQGSDY